MTHFQQAPELEVTGWLNTDKPITLSQLKGEVVVIHAFQMLCPGCVSHGLPQIKAVQRLYAEAPVNVIGLHSVFEHHQVMDPAALAVFVSEYGLTFPIAIDAPAEHGPIPKTMSHFALRGTPSLLVLDKQGLIRLNHFGQISDLALGNLIGQLLAEPSPDTSKPRLQHGSIDPATPENKTNCDQNGCHI